MFATVTLDDSQLGIIVGALAIETMDRREDAARWEIQGHHAAAMAAMRAARNTARVRRHVERAAEAFTIAAPGAS